MHTLELFDSDPTSEVCVEEVILPGDTDEAYRAMEVFAEEYHLHPLTVDDCVRRNQRSKIEAYHDYVFLVWHFFSVHSADPFEIQLVITSDSILMIAGEPPPRGASWLELFFPDGWLHRSLKDLVIDVLAQCVRDAEAHFDLLLEEATALESEMLVHLVDPADVLRLKRYVREFERTMFSAQPIFGQLHDFSKMAPDQRFRFRNVIDHFTRMMDATRQLESQLAALLDVHWGSTGARTNVQMQRLTAIATLVMPISFWSGLFGMNFETIPFKEPWFLALGVVLMVATWVGVTVYMFSRGVLIREAPGKRPPIFPELGDDSRRVARGRLTMVPAPSSRSSSVSKIASTRPPTSKV
ncbi:MAG: CorA family divalent cation transporter [Polyangiaceae bacterium]